MPRQFTRVSLFCTHCGVPFTVKAYRAHSARFCSSQCSADFRHGGDITQRLWRTVDRTANCWLWTGVSERGYGKIKYENRPMRTHQVAWILASGQPIPKGFVVCHTCDTRNCLRNDDEGTYELNGLFYPRFGHLWLAPSNIANIEDRDAKGRNVSTVHPELLARGEAHGRSVLTEARVLAIRADYATGKFSHAQLAAREGVSLAPIGKILRRETWRHI